MAATDAGEMLEIKRTLDGKIVEYSAQPLLLEPGVRAVLLCRIEVAEVVADGRITLQPGTLSAGYFWCDRPFNLYHWLYAGRTLVHYLNIGRFVSLSEDALVWDDYAVDVLAYPDGRVDVIDEDEIPEAVDAETREFIRQATDLVLAELDAIIAAVSTETQSLLSLEAGVVQR